MMVIGRFQGTLGEIVIWESLTSGDRLYLEGEIFQSQSSPSGESRLKYVQMFQRFLQPANNVLLLGCGGGNLATMLARTGKRVVVVDCNPTSFEIAREYFGMPTEIACITADFRQFLAETDESFDGIGIDVGGPGFCYREQFDAGTCSAIVGKINPGGRAILNMLVENDHDAAPDEIGADLSVGKSSGWILDRPGVPDRNVLIASLPAVRGPGNKRHIDELRLLGQLWTLRRPRHRPSVHAPVAVDITSDAGAL
jgi:SAM-dependent methyltransferase